MGGIGFGAGVPPPPVCTLLCLGRRCPTYGRDRAPKHCGIPTYVVPFPPGGKLFRKEKFAHVGAFARISGTGETEVSELESG